MNRGTGFTAEQLAQAVRVAGLDIVTLSDATDITNPERRQRALDTLDTVYTALLLEREVSLRLARALPVADGGGPALTPEDRVALLRKDLAE